MKRIFLAALALSATAMLSCKTDTENDIRPGDSDVSGLFINEIYSCNPDWVELYNSSDEDIELDGFILQDDKGAEEEYVFERGTVIGAGEFLVVEDFTFGISSSKGDRVVLLDASRNEVDAVSIPVMEDGTSYGRKSDGGNEWGIMTSPTKGTGNSGGGSDDTPGESTVKVLLNEIMSAPAGDDMDFIEIYNAENREVDLGGFILQDDKGAAEEFVIPQGTVIAAGGFVVFEQVSPGEGDSFTFGLSSKGDEVIFLDADRNVVDKVDTPDYGDTKGQSYARTVDGAGEWSVTDTPTKGGSNGGAPQTTLKGILMINEVYTYADGSDPDDLDFIELYNAGDQTIDLSGLVLWESGGQAEAWTVPQGRSIEAGGYFVIECDKDNALFGDPENYPAWGLSKGPDEYIALADADMAEIDRVECPSMKRDESYGRVTDGDSQWQIFAACTKGETNMGPARQPVTNDIGLWINEVFTNNQDTENLPWNESVDFIEFYNSADSDIDFGGYVIKDDKGADDESFTVPDGTVIPSKGFLTYDVVKNDPSGPSFGLGKSGDWVFVYAPDGTLVAELEIPAFEDDEILSYGRKTDGGAELVKMEVTKNASNAGNDGNPVQNGIWINEVLTNGSEDEDWVEFYNSGTKEFDLSGYMLYDDAGKDDKDAFTFPDGSVVAAGGYLVLTTGEEGSFQFGLGKKGDELHLIDRDGRMVDEVEIPALDDDETYGRRTDASAEWVVFTTSTRGGSNAAGIVSE